MSLSSIGLLGVVVLVASLQGILADFALDNHVNCTLWASAHECNRNPPFMWTHCIPACVKHARNDDQRCEAWAEGGECANNPGYIQPHCPESCGYALGWHGAARAGLGLPARALHPGNDHPEWAVSLEAGGSGVHSAAVLLVRRVRRVLSGGAFVGLAEVSPSSLLQAYGLVETLVYALRALELHLSSAAGAGDAVGIRVSVEEAVTGINDLLSFSGDELARQLPAMLRLAETAAGRVETWQQEQQGLGVAVDGTSEASVEGGGAKLVRWGWRHAGPEVVPQAQILPSASVAGGVFRLADGALVPALGFATEHLRESECEAATLEAIRLGYRRIDVAASDEADCAGAVGRGIALALEAGLVSRQELFVVVRLPAQEYGVNVGPRALALVRALGASYVDLCLLPAPMASLQQQTLAWRALEDIHSQGLLRSLGVVDFDGYKLRELLALAEVAPVVVQNKYDVYHRGEQIDNVGDDVEAVCREGRVLLMGYSPFSGLPFALLPLEDPFVRALALARGVSPATILLKWTLQRGVPVVVHSVNGAHLAANLAAAAAVVTPDCADYRLSADEMATLSGLAYLLESPFVRPA